MAFLIRTLSIKATQALDAIIKDKNSINTKTGAIEFLLESYQYNQKLQSDYNSLKNEHYHLNREMDSIKATFKKIMQD